MMRAGEPLCSKDARDEPVPVRCVQWELPSPRHAKRVVMKEHTR